MSRKKAKSRRQQKAPPKRQPGRRFPRCRKWLARLLAVVLAPSLVLAGVELGLWLFDYGYDASYFIESEDGDSLLSNPKFGWRFFGPELSRPPLPTVLSPQKPENTYRVFVFGGSAAQGVPDPAFSFARILEAMLADRFPQTRFEVINTAMVAVNSHVVLPIVRQCRGLCGDLFVVYLGNNEVVGPYGAGTIFGGPSQSLTLIRASICVRSTRLGQLIGNTARAIAGEDPDARKEWGGMGMFLDHRVTADDPRMEVVYDNFRSNLEDIAAAAADAGVPLLLCTVLTNLKDCPPFHSVHRPGLSDDEAARWEDVYRLAVVLEQSGRHVKAAASYEAAAEIDEKFAELHFRLGRCYLASGQPDPARRHFVLARDLDALRFRADTRINEIIRRVADDRTRRDVHLVDTQEVFLKRGGTPHGIPGCDLLHEHVHLSFQGNYLVAAAMFEKIVPLLPPDVRRQAAHGGGPPSLGRCRELTLHTPLNRFFGATKIARITADPPFRPEHARRSADELRKLKPQLTVELLGQMAQQYRRALKQRPDDLLLREVLAAVQSNRKQHASAADQYAELLRLYPYSTEWHCELGTALLRQGKTEDAAGRFRSALELDANHVEAHTRLASALVKLQRLDEAIEHLRRVLAIRPADAQAHFRLGTILLQQGDVPQAQRHFQTAVEIDPDVPSFHHYLARSLVAAGDNAAAVGSYRRAIELEPGFGPSLNDLAWIYATEPDEALRDGDQAVILAQRAAGLCDRGDAAVLDTLAAAYAEAGQLDRAAQTAREAVTMAERAKDSALAGQIRRRLELYRSGRPFRDGPG